MRSKINEKINEFRNRFKAHKDEGVMPSFIPYAAHLNEDTILTKNGEILQVIELSGVHEEEHNSQDDVRNWIQSAISSNISEPANFSIWINTLRRTTNLDINATKPEDVPYFSYKLHSAWSEKNNLYNQFEVITYITIIHKGKNINITNAKTFMTYFAGDQLRHDFFEYIGNSLEQLNEVSAKIIEDLKMCNAKKLGLCEVDGAVYSDVLSFFYELIYYEKRFVPLSFCDIADTLSIGSNITFANQHFTITQSNVQGEKFYGIFSFKTANQPIHTLINRLLEIDVVFNLYQALDFAYLHKSEDAYEANKKILVTYGSFAQKFANNLQDKLPKRLEHFMQQVCLVFVANSLGQFNAASHKLFDFFKTNGLMAVREDIFMEDSFYGSLPSNFQFIKRQKLGILPEIAQFSLVNSYINTDKAIQKRIWSECITVLKTRKNSNLFFHYYNSINEHLNTLIAGPRGCGKTAFSNFLVSESLKFKPFVVEVALDSGSELFFKSCGGSVYHVDQWNTAFLNPFFLISKKSFEKYLVRKSENVNFLKLFVINLFEISVGYKATNEQRDYISKLINGLVKKGGVENGFNIDSFLDIVQDSDIRQGLFIWGKTGKYSGLFATETDVLDEALEDAMVLFNLEKTISVPRLFVPLLKYFIYVLKLKTFFVPRSLIKIDEAWSLFDNPIFGSFALLEFLQDLNKNNAATILSFSVDEVELKGHITSSITSVLGLQIFFPDLKQRDIYRDVFNFSDSDMEALADLKVDIKEFIIKKPDDSVAIASFNMRKYKEIVGIISNTQQAREAYEYAISMGRTNDLAKIWQVFINRFNR
jgi:type IV secretion system protein VirB4